MYFFFAQFQQLLEAKKIAVCYKEKYKNCGLATFRFILLVPGLM